MIPKWNSISNVFLNMKFWEAFWKRDHILWFRFDFSSKRKVFKSDKVFVQTLVWVEPRGVLTTRWCKTKNGTFLVRSVRCTLVATGYPWLDFILHHVKGQKSETLIPQWRRDDQSQSQSMWRSSLGCLWEASQDSNQCANNGDHW